MVARVLTVVQIFFKLNAGGQENETNVSGKYITWLGFEILRGQ